MSAARYDLVIDQGSDFSVEFTIKEAGVVKDLSGHSARAQLRPTKSSSILSGSFSCTIPTPANGKIVMSLGNSVSSAVTAGIFYYDLELYTSGDAVVSRLLYGEVTVTQEVTR
jgi:hypothetical protein